MSTLQDDLRRMVQTVFESAEGVDANHFIRYNVPNEADQARWEIEGLKGEGN